MSKNIYLYLNLYRAALTKFCSVAPVQEVDVEFSGDSVTFKAEGIYPAPNLTWSTDPPSDARLLQPKTKSQKTRLGLYDIESTITLKENTQTYICCVSSDTDKKTIFLKHEGNEVLYLWYKVHFAVQNPSCFTLCCSFYPGLSRPRHDASLQLSSQCPSKL